MSTGRFIRIKKLQRRWMSGMVRVDGLDTVHGYLWWGEGSEDQKMHSPRLVGCFWTNKKNYIFTCISRQYFVQVDWVTFIDLICYIPETLRPEVRSLFCAGGDSTESQDCNKDGCPEPTEWSGWSQCSKSCGGGTRTKTRQCNQVRSYLLPWYT